MMQKILDWMGLERKSFVSPSMSELEEMFTGKNRLPDSAQHDYGEYLKAYADRPWVFVCVSRIASAWAALPIQISDDKGKIQPDGGPLMNLLYKPNPLMDLSALRNFTLASLELTGNAYWLMDARLSSGKGVPTQIWPMISSGVQIVPSGNSLAPIKAYRYHAAGKTVEYLPEDVIHFKYPNSRDLLYGLAPLSAARTKVDIMQAADNYNRSFFDNSANVSGILSTEQKLDPTHKARMIATWNSSHQGESKANRIALLEGGLKWTQTAVNQADMQFIDGQKLTREDVLAIFGVPPAVACIHSASGMGTSASSAAKEQQQLFYQNTIFPKDALILGTMTERLLPLFDKSRRFYFVTDRSSLSGILSDVQGKSAAADVYQRMGFTRNEVIDALGLPFRKDPSGDTRYEPQYIMQSASIGGLSMRGVKAAGDNLIRPTRAQMRTHQLARHALLDKAAPVMEQAVAATFHDKKAKLLAGDIPKSYDDVFSLAAEAEKLADAKVPAMEAALEVGRLHENELLEDLIGSSRRMIVPMAKAKLTDWAKTHALRWAKESEDFTKREIDAMLSDVEEARLAGASVEDLKRQISDRMDTMEAYRSRRIAQTETMSALNQSALVAYDETPEVMRKGWLATLDEATRESHAEAGRRYGPGGEIPVDEDFQVGDGFGPAPGQISAVGEDVNCRCTVYPVVKGE